MPEPFDDLTDLESNYLSLLPQEKDISVLDIGCGKGRVIQFLLEHGYLDVAGIDIDPTVVEWARLNVSEKVETISDLASFLEKHEGVYDLIIAKDVVYYFDSRDRDATVMAMRRALKPSGLCLVEVFNGATFTGPYVQYKDHQILTIYTEQSLSALLEANGFVVERLIGTRTSIRSINGWLLRVAAATWRALLRGIYLLERGKDEQNPRILTKKIIAVARPQQDSSPYPRARHA